MWERTCSICLSQTDLFLLTWWSPLSFTFLQTTKFYSWHNDTHIYHIFFIHSLVGKPLEWFHNLAIVNSAAIDMDVLESLLYDDLCSFRYMPKSGIAGSYGISILVFFGKPPYWSP
jgi:hypothetical protein